MYQLKINSILLDEKNEKFFGNGPLYLLQAVKEYGSLSKAAKALNMSYSKAFRLIKKSEEALGFDLLISSSGGSKGGSSILSDKAEIFLSSYKEYALANNIYGNSHLDDLMICDDLKDINIIILASGQGKRFKENKLLYKINNQYLITYLLKTLIPIKDICIISTIHKEIVNIGEKLGFEVAYHNDESLSASIKSGLSLIKKDNAIIFVHGDQPLLSLTSIMRLIKAYKNNPKTVKKISYQGIKASPTLFIPKYYNQLKKLKCEEGGSILIKNNNDKVEEVEALFPWEIWDIDKKEELKYFEGIFKYLGK